MSIGANIRRLREERGLTQEKLAEKINVTFQAVSSWEREEYKPDTDNLLRLAQVLDVSVSAIVEERQNTLKVEETIFNWEHMKTYVKTMAKAHRMENALAAMDFAVKAHKGQTRKRSTVPYIYHPLNLACHVLALGIMEDEVIAACLLHDVVEDTGKSLAELPVNDRTKELVKLLTRVKPEPPKGVVIPEGRPLTVEEEKKKAEVRAKNLKSYYAAIAKDPEAALIKCIDRCNNITSMAWGLSRDKVYMAIKETEEHYPRLIKAVRSIPKYNNAAWLIQYQMATTLNIYKWLM